MDALSKEQHSYVITLQPQFIFYLHIKGIFTKANKHQKIKPHHGQGILQVFKGIHG